ncbi:MAG: flagellar biosynthesis protein FlhA [Marinovum sp.]|nr:flagellar biosynthesis protein FlhA [Marinovum sp.]
MAKSLDIKSIFQPTVFLAVALLVIIIMMVLPVPAWMLDVGLAISFALAVLIFTTTLFIEKPLEFSAFPTILVAALVLRLSLNVSSTKLIIGDGHTGTDAAGGVIEGFANFVMGGNVFLGVVIFCVLLIVNFVVITKGATRMAEVGARFALDGMPGKQLAIDADVSAGAITHEEAKVRRDLEQQETTFFGSLDGASKFVKGDAIAGLLITLLNLVVGLIMGTIVHGMPLGLAFETYAILTVGDGLVTQIPAVIISIASALLLARGGADIAVAGQLSRYPGAIATVSVLMAIFALVPGLPFVPFMLGAIGLGALSYTLYKQKATDTTTSETPEDAIAPFEKPIGDILDLDDIHVVFSSDLVSLVLDPGTGLDGRINNMRNHIASRFGLIMPEIRLTDDMSLTPGTYIIRVFGVEKIRAQLNADMVLALVGDGSHQLPLGDDVNEPVYGAPARWIKPEHQDALSLEGVTIVTPTEVLATHLLEVIKRNFGRLLTMKSLRRLLDEMIKLSDPARAEANRKFLDEMIPDRVPIDLLHSVMRLLLDEQVSIRNVPLILESIAEVRHLAAQPDAVCEHVRQKMGFQIVSELQREDGTIPLIQFAPEWEETFNTYQVEPDRGGLDVALPPDVFNRLSDVASEKATEVSDRGVHAAFVTSARRRRFLRTVLSAKGLANPVLSFEEIGFDAQPALVGIVDA